MHTCLDSVNERFEKDLLISTLGLAPIDITYLNKVLESPLIKLHSDHSYCVTDRNAHILAFPLSGII